MLGTFIIFFFSLNKKVLVSHDSIPLSEAFLIILAICFHAKSHMERTTVTRYRQLIIQIACIIVSLMEKYISRT